MEGFRWMITVWWSIFPCWIPLTWADKETIEVGPGCVGSELYNEILPKGGVIPGGSCATVAVGGLVLGGGYGLLARKLGLTCDSLVELTMVDGNGNIISTNTDKELLWACKGGNGNFGVITCSGLKHMLHPKPCRAVRFKTYKTDVAKATNILKTWFEAVALFTIACFSAYVLNGKTALYPAYQYRKEQCCSWKK